MNDIFLKVVKVMPKESSMISILCVMSIALLSISLLSAGPKLQSLKKMKVLNAHLAQQEKNLDTFNREFIRKGAR